MTADAVVLATLLLIATPSEGVTLTPETIAEHGFHLRCVAVDESEDREDPLTVHVRFGPFPGSSDEELARIKDISLVVRDRGGEQFRVPVHAEVDPGNRVHLYVKLSAQREWLPKLLLAFSASGDRGEQKFIARLEEFIDQN